MKTINLKAYTKPQDDENLVEVGKGNSLLHVYKDVELKTKDELNKTPYRDGYILGKEFKQMLEAEKIMKEDAHVLSALSCQNMGQYKTLRCENRRIRANVNNVDHIEKPLKGEKELRDSINKEIEAYERDKVKKERQKESLKFVGLLAMGLWLVYIYIIPLI